MRIVPPTRLLALAVAFLSMALSLAAIAAPAQADVGEKIILRCTHGESLSGFTQKDYEKALKELETSLEEYSGCASLIHQAQRAAAGSRGGSERRRRSRLDRHGRYDRRRHRHSGRATQSQPRAERRRGAAAARRPGGSPRRRACRHRLRLQLAAHTAAGGPPIPARVRGCARGGSAPKPCPPPRRLIPLRPWSSLPRPAHGSAARARANHGALSSEIGRRCGCSRC